MKASSYLTLVHPIMEYAASVWDPYHHNDIQTLEKVQRRAARWVMNDYSWYGSVSNMLNNLNWPSLHLRHRISRLQTFYKATYKLSALSIPSYFAPPQRLTRHFHPLHYRMTTNFGEANIWRLAEKLQLAEFLFGESLLT